MEKVVEKKLDNINSQYNREFRDKFQQYCLKYKLIPISLYIRKNIGSKHKTIYGFQFFIRVCINRMAAKNPSNKSPFLSNYLFFSDNTTPVDTSDSYIIDNIHIIKLFLSHTFSLGNMETEGLEIINNILKYNA